jgi:hypothetical protein
MADRTSYLELTFKHAIDDAKLRVGVECCVRVRVDVTKFPFGAWFGSTDASH